MRPRTGPLRRFGLPIDQFGELAYSVGEASGTATLSAPAGGGSLGTPGTATLYIVDDD